MEQLLGKRISFFTYNSKLVDANGCQVCAADLKQWSQEGHLYVNHVGNFHLVHDLGNMEWSLNDSSSNTVCTARKPDSSRNIVILELLDENRCASLRFRTQPHKSSIHVRQVGLNERDADVIKHVYTDDPVVTFSSKTLRKDWRVEKKPDVEMSATFFSFIYIMLALLHRAGCEYEATAMRKYRQFLPNSISHGLTLYLSFCPVAASGSY